MKKNIIYLFLLLLFSGCGTNRYDYTFIAFGNIPIKISIYGTNKPYAHTLFSEIKDSIYVLDSLFNKYQEYGLIYKFNNENISINNPHITNIILQAETIRDETFGLFDIRIETLLRYYHDCEKYDRELNYDSIEFFVNDIDDTLYFDCNGNLYKKHEILKIDLGGIAKGYAAEMIKTYLKNMDIKKGIIDLAGDILVFNESDNTPFTIGIRDKSGEGIYRNIEISNGAIMTSGDYYRFYMIKGKKYNHIINPITGLDINPINSVTVICDNAVKADAYATAIMLMNDSIRKTFLNEHNDIKIIVQ